jgi:hypothetical protein
MASIHYLFNQGYGADIDWLKNSNYGGFIPGVTLDTCVDQIPRTLPDLPTVMWGINTNLRADPTMWGEGDHSFAVWIKPQSTDFIPGFGPDLGIMDAHWFTIPAFSMEDTSRKTVKIVRSGAAGNPLTLRVEVYDDTIQGRKATWEYTTGSGDMSSIFPKGLNEWTLFAYSWDQSAGTVATKITVWVDGNQYTPSSTSGSAATSTKANTFGTNIGSTKDPRFFPAAGFSSKFNARFHRAGFWADELTQTMINYLYNGGSPGSVDWQNAAPSGAYDAAMVAAMRHYYKFGDDQTFLPLSAALDTGNPVGNLQDLVDGGETPVTINGDPEDDGSQSGTYSTTLREYPFAENLISLWQWGALPEDAFTTEGNAMRDWGHYAYRGDLNRSREIEPVASGKSSNSWGATTTVTDILSPLTLAWDTDTPGTGFVEAEGTIADNGSTMSAFSYPGQGFRSVSEAQGGNDVNRPDTTDGVLDEPKTYNDGEDTERQGSYP